MAREFSGSLTLVYPRIMIWKNEQWVPLKEGTIFYITTPSRSVVIDSAAVPVQRPRQQTQRWCWQFRMGRNGYLQSVRDGLPRYGRAPCINWMFPSEPGPGYKFFIHNLPELFSNWNLWDAEMATTNTLVSPVKWESDIKNVRRNQFSYPRNDNDNAPDIIARVTDRARQVIRLKPAFKRAFPIVVVAGAMASRLEGLRMDGTPSSSEPDERKLWDPDNRGFMVGLSLRSAERKRELLGIYDGCRNPRARLLWDNIKNIASYRRHRRLDRGFATILTGSYQNLLLALDDHYYANVINQGNGGNNQSQTSQTANNGNGAGLSDIIAPVYAIGYDFRQDIQLLKDYLYDRLTDIENEINNHDTYTALNAEFSGFILVTHSMGGLVSRSCLRHYPAIEAKVKCVIHGAQPVVGAPKFYGYFRLGGDEYHGLFIDGIEGVAFQNIIGYSSNDFATLASALPGALQLAPSDNYTFDNYNNRFNWIKWDPEQHRLLAFHNQPLAAKAKQTPDNMHVLDDDPSKGYSIYDVYADSSGLVGMLPSDFRRGRRLIFNDLNNRAKQFHEAVDSYKHPTTYQINLRGHETANHFEIYEPRIWSRNRGDGDGTVPLKSQNYLLSGNGASVDPSRDFTIEASSANDQTHQDIFNRDDVIEKIKEWVGHILSASNGGSH